MDDKTLDDLRTRAEQYLRTGGLFNPELANHDAVRDLVRDLLAALTQLRTERDQEQQARIAEVEHWVARYREVDAWRVATAQRAEARIPPCRGGHPHYCPNCDRTFPASQPPQEG